MHMPSRSGVLIAMNAGWSADFMRYNLRVAALHGVRRLPALLDRNARSALTSSPALQSHARLDGGDAFFCLAHRHYLARGLGASGRIAAALGHYQAIDLMVPPVIRQAVLAPGGLVLWNDRQAEGGPEFRLVLGEGRDVTTEGGLSVVLEIDGAPLSVLSFSLVPAAVLRQPAAAGPGGLLPFIGRKQTSMNTVARDAFARRFDRVDPAGMTFAGLSAFARQLGFVQAFGVGAMRHPSWSTELAAVFANAYDGFWQSLSGGQAGPFGWLIDLPARYAAVEGMNAAKRARALRRRAHLLAAEAAAAQHLAGLAHAG